MKIYRLLAGFFAAALAASIAPLCAQEVLLSSTEQYYDFLALDGYAERPYLNYRTLSDSEWQVTGESGNLWAGNNLGTTLPLGDNVNFRIYGPELFSSYNTAAPYGQNDGALWQGKGLNSSLSAGARLEGYGFELTLKPVVGFSQKLGFELVPFYKSGLYSGSLYEGKAGIYGYFGVPSLDAPQRFGTDPLYSFSWGDSEIRYTWKNLTAGFGTQAVWLGPARINPILMSNNAAPFPKIDVGLRKQSVNLFDMYFGEVETRAFWGFLSESDYFDNDSYNNHNLLTGLSASYAPSIIPGFTLGINRTMLSKWSAMDSDSILTLVWPVMEISAGSDERDQRFSVAFDYSIPTVGFETYFEWARNDFSPSYDHIIRYPFHTQAYTLGFINKHKFQNFHMLKGQLNLEFTNLESSRDYEFIAGDTSFYNHGIILQGYTNEGQWLGAGMGTGGNSQYLGYTLYYPKGKTNLFLQRKNPDNDYIWYLNSDVRRAEKGADEAKIRVDVSVGMYTAYYITSALSINGGFVLTDFRNYAYESSFISRHIYNNSFYAGCSYNF